MNDNHNNVSKRPREEGEQTSAVLTNRWRAFKLADTDKWYYQNVKTNTVQWELPPGVQLVNNIPRYQPCAPFPSNSDEFKAIHRVYEDALSRQIAPRKRPAYAASLRDETISTTSLTDDQSCESIINETRELFSKPDAVMNVAAFPKTQAVISLQTQRKISSETAKSILKLLVESYVGNAEIANFFGACVAHLEGEPPFASRGSRTIDAPSVNDLAMKSIRPLLLQLYDHSCDAKLLEFIQVAENEQWLRQQLLAHPAWRQVFISLVVGATGIANDNIIVSQHTFQCADSIVQVIATSGHHLEVALASRVIAHSPLFVHSRIHRDLCLAVATAPRMLLLHQPTPTDGFARVPIHLDGTLSEVDSRLCASRIACSTEVSNSVFLIFLAQLCNRIRSQTELDNRLRRRLLRLLHTCIWDSIRYTKVYTGLKASPPSSQNEMQMPHCKLAPSCAIGVAVAARACAIASGAQLNSGHEDGMRMFCDAFLRSVFLEVQQASKLCAQVVDSNRLDNASKTSGADVDDTNTSQWSRNLLLLVLDQIQYSPLVNQFTERDTHTHVLLDSVNDVSFLQCIVASIELADKAGEKSIKSGSLRSKSSTDGNDEVVNASSLGMDSLKKLFGRSSANLGNPQPHDFVQMREQIGEDNLRTLRQPWIILKLLQRIFTDTTDSQSLNSTTPSATSIDSALCATADLAPAAAFVSLLSVDASPSDVIQKDTLSMRIHRGLLLWAEACRTGRVRLLLESLLVQLDSSKWLYHSTAMSEATEETSSIPLSQLQGLCIEALLEYPACGAGLLLFMFRRVTTQEFLMNTQAEDELKIYADAVQFLIRVQPRLSGLCFLVTSACLAIRPVYTSLAIVQADKLRRYIVDTFVILSLHGSEIVACTQFLGICTTTLDDRYAVDPGVVKHYISGLQACTKVPSTATHVLAVGHLIFKVLRYMMGPEYTDKAIAKFAKAPPAESCTAFTTEKLGPAAAWVVELLASLLRSSAESTTMPPSVKVSANSILQLMTLVNPKS